MRLAGQVKMGYYPTPPRVVELLKPLITFTSYRDETFALDPCCGEGGALASLAAGTTAKTFGIELDAARAKEAKPMLKHVVHASFDQVDISPEGFGLLFLNPPYDDEEGERKELIFLRGTMDSLASTGVLVYIIPQKRLTRPIAELLAANFTDLAVYRFPDGEFERFGQIVILGRKNLWPLDSASQVERLLKCRTEEVPPLKDGLHGRYYVPASSGAMIREREVDPLELLKLAKGSPLIPRLQDFLEPRTLAEVTQPPTRLHVGHLGLLLAAGRLNGLVGEGRNLHLVAGRPVKHIVETTEVETDAEGNEQEVQKRLETFRVTIKILLPTGEMKKLI
jgi:hypothetical protein